MTKKSNISKIFTCFGRYVKIGQWYKVTHPYMPKWLFYIKALSQRNDGGHIKAEVINMHDKTTYKTKGFNGSIINPSRKVSQKTIDMIKNKNILTQIGDQ